MIQIRRAEQFTKAAERLQRERMGIRRSEAHLYAVTNKAKGVTYNVRFTRPTVESYREPHTLNAWEQIKMPKENSTGRRRAPNLPKKYREAAHAVYMTVEFTPRGPGDPMERYVIDIYDHSKSAIKANITRMCQQAGVISHRRPAKRLRGRDPRGATQTGC